MNTFGSRKHEGLVANNGEPITARTWDSGNIDGYSYQALVFPEPSDYGINNGNISKLSIKAPNGKVVVSYDRGWDIEPAGKAAKAILDKVLARYTVEQSSETKCNEAFAVYRGGPGYTNAFMIDCGSSERARALANAIQEEAYEHPLGSPYDDAGRHFLGGEIIQFWPVDRYFTAVVDPCDKAIEWCQEFLKNLDGEIVALTGNDAGLESNGNEALSPKLQKRRKFKAWQDNSLKLKGFKEAGYSFLDLCDGGGYTFDVMGVPTKCYDSEEKALAGAKKNFDDFDEYLDVSANYDPAGGPNGEPVWFAAFKLKDSFADLPEGEGLEVLSELSDTLYRMYTKGESASEDRRGTDRYGHHVKRFTTKDLKGLGDGNGDDAGAANKFGLAYLDTTSISAFSNNFSTSVRDRFLHDLAQMPVSKKSIEDLLRKHQLSLYGRTVGVRDFFPENGIAYLGTIGEDGLPRKSLCLKWGPALKK